MRKRQAVLINRDLLIDLGPDLYASCAQLGLSLTELKYALVTHSHPDHFQAINLLFRARGFRLQTELPLLTLAVPPSVRTLWERSGGNDAAAELVTIPIRPTECLSLSPYQVTAVEATHIDEAVNYIVSDGERQLLYACDTGLYREHVWETLRPHRFDAVIVECTLGSRQRARTHMSIADMQLMLDRLRELGCIGERTQLVATHFSHQQVDPHAELAEALLEIGVRCAYDGMVLSV